tara:strand:+ start:844 stop:1146 length:303 start_codon:yes stop_codon:yes gene_type:complete
MTLDHQAIRKAYPNVTFINDTNSVIKDAEGKDVAVEQSKIDAARVELDTEYSNSEYSRKRAEEYFSLQEQLDMQYWDAVNGTTNWKNHIAAVKSKYPKPS